MSRYEDLHVTQLRADKLTIGSTAASNPRTPHSELCGATITVGAEAGDDVAVAIQLEDVNGDPIDHAACVPFYLASDAAGLNPLTTGPDGGMAIGTDGAYRETNTNIGGFLTSEIDGDIDLVVTDAGAFTSYPVVVLPNGKLVVGAVITHTA